MHPQHEQAIRDLKIAVTQLLEKTDYLDYETDHQSPFDIGVIGDCFEEVKRAIAEVQKKIKLAKAWDEDPRSPDEG